MLMLHTPESIQHAIDTDLERLRSKPHVEPLSYSYTLDGVTSEVRGLYADTFPGIELPELDVVAPPKGIEADLAAPAFTLSRLLRKAPAAIAGEVVAHSDPAGTETIAQVEQIGPYVNVGLNREAVFSSVVDEANRLNEAYGNSNTMRDETHIIDYSSPNGSKLMGFQHTRTTFVGEANARIQEANGAKVVRTNYFGDFGKPTGKILLAIEKYGLDLDGSDPVRDMNDLYVRISRETKDDPVLNAEADLFAARLEEGDPEVVRIWEKIRGLSIEENDRLYQKLGINFDTTVGESHFVEGAHEIADDLLRRGIAIEDDGAVIVPAQTIKDATGEKNAEILMLRNSRGKTTYGARDLAAIRYRIETYGATSIEYVVGAEQGGYLSAVFAVAGLSGIAKGVGLHHTELGLLLNSAGKKMSSRDGSALPLIDQMDEEYTKSLSAIRAKGTIVDEEEQRKLAEALGYGNIVYPIVSKDPSTNIALGGDISQFSEAGSAGYVQYSHARAASVVRESGVDSLGLVRARLDTAPTEAEWRLTKTLMNFPAAVRAAGTEYSPAHIASSIEEIASAFNTFYQLDSIRSAPTPERRVARLALTNAVRVALRNGLNLLNVGAPQKM